MKPLLILLPCLLLLGAAPRSTTDFEIAALQKEIGAAKDSIAKGAARLNLGDLLASRGRVSDGRAQHLRALEDLTAAASRARRSGDFTSYARALAYSGLAEAKLGNRASAIRIFEEVMRYGSNSDVLWNLRASAMTVLREHDRAVASSRNAIALASDALDLDVYRYALASALVARKGEGDIAEAETVLRTLLDDLQSERFARLRREVAENERFEVLSAARGDAAAWVSLQNRARLRLAAVLEERGRLDEAAREYRRVLAARDDDANALAGLARVTTGAERSRMFEASFESNPFSPRLIAQYETFLREGGTFTAPSASSNGARMRSAIRDLVDGRYARALETVDALRDNHPQVTVLADFQRRIQRAANEPLPLPEFLRSPSAVAEAGEADLKLLLPLLRGDRLDQSSRAALDRAVLRSLARFNGAEPGPDGTTTLSRGAIGELAFRFPSPTAFRGTFDPSKPLVVQYRIAGLGEIEGREELVLEPLGVSTP